MPLFSCGAGRVKTYRQWKAWAGLGRLRFFAEFAWYGQGVGVVFGPGFGLTLYLLFCSVEILAYHSLKAEHTAGA